MQKILLVTGKKQSGKSSLVRFLHGHIMKKNQAIRCFDINEHGKLEVNALIQDENGNEREEMGEIDIHRRDFEFAQFASESIWPFCKVYSFAEPLKESIINIFGVERSKLYGNNDEKNESTTLKFSDFAFALLPKEIEKLKKDDKYHNFMTAREVAQIFGTRVCRRIQDRCWLDRTLEKIVAEECEFPMIDDGRFINEVEPVKLIGGKVLRLT